MTRGGRELLIVVDTQDKSGNWRNRPTWSHMCSMHWRRVIGLCMLISAMDMHRWKVTVPSKVSATTYSAWPRFLQHIDKGTSTHAQKSLTHPVALSNKSKKEYIKFIYMVTTSHVNPLHIQIYLKHAVKWSTTHLAEEWPRHAKWLNWVCILPDLSLYRGAVSVCPSGSWPAYSRAHVSWQCVPPHSTSHWHRQ